MTTEEEMRKLLPDLQKESYFSTPSYDQLIETFGYSLLLDVTDSDYQGDTRTLFADGERRGLLVFGWGSCSGCDSLQAVCNYKDLAELHGELFDKIEWEPNAAAMAAKLTGKDWEASFLRNEENARFVTEALAILA
jgi:hypothetical protein